MVFFRVVYDTPTPIVDAAHDQQPSFPDDESKATAERLLPRSRLPRQPPGKVEMAVDEVRLYRCWLLAGLRTLTNYREYRQLKSLQPPGCIRPCRPSGTLCVIILSRCVNNPRTAA